MPIGSGSQRSAVSRGLARRMRLATSLRDVTSQFGQSPTEALEFWAGGVVVGASLLAESMKERASSNAIELLNNGFHLEAARILLDSSLKAQALVAINIGLSAHQKDEDPIIYERLLEMQSEAEYLPGR